MAVFEAIAAAGHIPVFLDVDLETYGLDHESLRRNKDRLDALVVVHTFGYPADLDGIRACLEGRRIPIIEDCAHSVLSEYHDRLTGTLTEASFFSFGVHKPAATGGGGMIVVNQPALVERAEQEVGALRVGAASEELRHAVGTWLRSLAYCRLLYGILMASPLGRWRDVDRGDPEAKAAEALGASWSPAGVRRVNHTLVEGRLRGFEAKLSRLAENSRKLRKLAENAPLAVPPDPAWGKWNYFMLPVRYPTAQQRDAGRSYLRSRGLDTCALYQNCERNARLFGYLSGCPQAEEAARTICTVPNHSWLAQTDIDYIGRCLRESVEPRRD
jgi:dTDP-4-amino-4,6-dideoxygalactose transaminase